MTAPTNPPIDPSEIRKSDRVRVEFEKTTIDGFSAIEYVAEHDGEHYDADRHYLLDRPTPPVTLPTEPTLGWVRVFDPSAGGARGTELGIWVGADDRGRTVRFTEDRGDRVLQRTREFDAAHVTAFTPATAVPTEALQRLRVEHDVAFKLVSDEKKNEVRRDAIEAFLDAIEATS